MEGRRLINNDPFGIKIDCKLQLCADGCGLWMRFVDAVCRCAVCGVRFVMCGVALCTRGADTLHLGR